MQGFLVDFFFTFEILIYIGLAVLGLILLLIAIKHIWGWESKVTSTKQPSGNLYRIAFGLGPKADQHKKTKIEKDMGERKEEREDKD